VIIGWLIGSMFPSYQPHIKMVFRSCAHFVWITAPPVSKKYSIPGKIQMFAIQEHACYISSMMTLLSHVDPAENMMRWYLVTVQATLFHPCSVVIAWGRRDNEFQQWRVIPVESRAQADLVAAKIVERKIRRGYQAQPGKEK
jgi:predicted DNA-binding WGR domain protein